MNPDKHVYCTNCKHFPMNTNGECKSNCPNCYCFGCDCQNWEDSKPFSERPRYEEVDLSQKENQIAEQD